MADRKTTPKYSEDFKKTIVSLYQSGKTYSEIQKEYPENEPHGSFSRTDTFWKSQQCGYFLCHLGGGAIAKTEEI